jgi:hypothetical protein
VQAQATVICFLLTAAHQDIHRRLEGCLPPDLIGTPARTETTTGQVVDTGKDGANVHGVNTFDYHGDFRLHCG